MKIRKKGDNIFFEYDGCKYVLTSHPYEPCLYIKLDGKMIAILHNAFDAYDLPDIFAAGEKLKSISGRMHDEESVCRILAAAVDKQGEYNFTDFE